jgi:hypothetical protein
MRPKLLHMKQRETEASWFSTFFENPLVSLLHLHYLGREL